jgi:hypothetical protein
MYMSHHYTKKEKEIRAEKKYSAASTLSECRVSFGVCCSRRKQSMQRTNRRLHLRADGLLLDRSWRAESIRLPQRGKSGEDEYEVNQDAWRARGHELRAVLHDFDNLPSRNYADDYKVAQLLHELGWTYKKAPLGHDNNGAATILAESARMRSALMIASGDPHDHLKELFHSTLGWAQAVDDAGDQPALATQLYNHAKALFDRMNGKAILKHMLVPLDKRLNDINLNALPMAGAARPPAPLVYQLLPGNLPYQPLLNPIQPVGSPLAQLPPLPAGFAYPVRRVRRVRPPAQVPAAQAQPPPIQVQAPPDAQAPVPAVPAPPVAAQAPPPVAQPLPPAEQAPPPAVQAQPAAVAVSAPPPRATGKRPRERLEELEEMKDFLTDTEYQAKRAEIIASV